MNKCIFTGRITHTPELRTTPSGKSVCKFSIAVENGYGENKTTVFPALIAWNGQAEFVSKLAKGSKITAVTRLDERSYEDKSGNKRKATEFTVSEIEAMEPKQKNAEQTTTLNENTGFVDVEDEALPF